MSIGTRYRHTLVIKQLTYDGSTDSYGQPVGSTETVATVAGLVQPRSAREVALASQSGAVIGTHVGYLDPIPGLLTGAWIDLDGVRYDITGIANAGGVGHHLELNLRQVT